MVSVNENSEVQQTEIVTTDESAIESTTAKSIDEPPMEKAKRLLTEGKRHLICSNFGEAINCFNEAVQLNVEKFGETSIECAESYFFYGKSLIESEKSKGQNIISGADEDNKDNEENESEEEEGDENNDADEIEDAAAVETKENINDEPKESGDSESLTTTMTENKNGEQNVAVVASTEDVVETEINDNNGADADDDAEDQADDESDAILAWDMLDLARVILEKEGGNTEAHRLRLADVRMYLGDVRVFKEEFELAVDEYFKCVEILKQILPCDDRRLAEAFFKIGSAFDFDQQYDQAASYLKQAISVLESKKSNLEKQLRKAGSKEEKDSMFRKELDEAESEIKELTGVIDDAAQRLNDMVECDKHKAETKKAIAECLGKQMENEGIANGNHKSESMDATDVQTLVRKPIKRNCDEIGGEVSETKRPRSQNGCENSDEVVAETESEKTSTNGTECAVDNGHQSETQNGGHSKADEQATVEAL